MEQENNEKEPESTVAAVETPAAEAKPEGLSRRESLEKAVEVLNNKAEEAKPEVQQQAQPVQQEEEIEPPNSFSAAEKEAFRKGDIKAVNKAFARLEKERRSEVSQIHRDRDTFKKEKEAFENESKTYKDLTAKLKPYIEAQGAKGVPPETALLNALNLFDLIKKDKAGAKAAIDEIPGEERIEQLENKNNLTSAEKSELRALQNEVNALKLEREQEKTERLANHFDSVFLKLQSRKSASGISAFPDIQNNETGMQMAAEIGSLVKEPVFRNLVLRRIPDASLEQFVEEAYKQLGGRITEENNTRSLSENKSKHIQRSRLAASSIPGRSSTTIAAKRKTLSRREALAQAAEDLKEH